MDAIKKVFSNVCHGTSMDKVPGPSPDGNPPPVSHSELSDPAMPIPRDILAYRTITTLYSKIQQESFRYTDTPKIKSIIRRRQLRVLNALANVAVAEHAVVAVMLNGQRVEYNEVIFTIGSAESGGQLTERLQDQAENDSGIGESEVEENTEAPGFFTQMRRYWDGEPEVVVVQNPRKDDLVNGTKQISRTDFSIPVISSTATNADPGGDICQFMAPCW